MVLTTLAIVAGLAAPPSNAAELTVTITGGKPANGQVLVGVFEDQATFLETAVASAVAQVDGIGRAKLRFDLNPGTYSIAVT